MRLDNVSDRARHLAESYVAQAVPDDAPRVLCTGFGPFKSHAVNATASMVAALVGRHAGEPPFFAQARVEGIAIAALVLPVAWELAPLLVLREIAAFAPQLVVMNGIAGGRREVLLELGAVNAARLEPDALGAVPRDASPMLAGAPAEVANLASWDALLAAGRAAVATRAADRQDGVRFDDVVRDVRLAEPRAGNVYLCNHTTFVVSHALTDANAPLTLLGAEVPPRTHAPRRLFVHWPDALRGAHIHSAVAVLRALIAAEALES
jgi:pyrrolidone-carboxylate peptidase